jgi:hypothetical protein
MVRWWLILMMALLPLHGWAGAAMSSAPGHEAPGPVHAAAPAHGLTDADPGAADPDCLEHAPAAHHHGAGTQTSTGTGSCPTCPTCHACSPAALVAAITAAAAEGFGAPRPQRDHSRFASADRAPGFKPPIS